MDFQHGPDSPPFFIPKLKDTGKAWVNNGPCAEDDRRDEAGNIGYQSYASGFANLLNSHQVNFDVHHRFNAASRVKGGLMYEQKPYGLSGAGAAVFYEYRL